MRFDLVVRRLHLYLALALLPWFVMYGISSVPFSHSNWFSNAGPNMQLRFERPYELPVDPGQNLRAAGARIMQDVGLEGSYGVSRTNDGRINLYVYTFRHVSQVTYFSDRKLLRVEDRRFRWTSFLTGMHARGGFENATPGGTVWAVVVDLVCVGYVLWIATGIYMWWKLRQTRFWGWLALGGGAVLFAIFMIAL